MDFEHTKKICKLGQGEECCAYLVCGANGFECAKNYPVFKETIGERVRNGMMNAKGDHCDGYKENN
jgi:hypothetical protein